MNRQRSLLKIIIVIILSLFSNQVIAADRPEYLTQKELRPTPQSSSNLQKSQNSSKTGALKGYCCKEGTFSVSTKAECQTSRGIYFATKREVMLKCAGFCCDDGSVNKSTEAGCKQKRGIFFSRERDAKKRCAEDRGFCCQDGKVSQSTIGSCKKKRGAFYRSKQTAAQSCRGFCCIDGKTTELSRQQCKNKKGTFFSSKAAAALKCKGSGAKFTDLKKNKASSTFSKRAPNTLQKKPASENANHPSLVLPTEEECRAYARSAADIADTAERSFCNFQGDRWSKDVDKHFNWCMTVSAAARIQEGDARLAEFRKCNDCGVYAQEAISQFMQANQNDCNLSGSGWQDDRNAHFDWCMNASPADRIKESKNRQEALQACGEIKLFTNPHYLSRPLDFCMYRRPETIRYSVSRPGPYFDGPMQIDFGWECGNTNVGTSYCISQGYDKAVDFKVSESLSSVDTITVGNNYRSDTENNLKTYYSNIRQFDYIMCRKWSDTEPESTGPKMKIKRKGEITKKDIKKLKTVTPEALITPEAACEIYAQTSVEQYHHAVNTWCTAANGGFVPSVWNGDFNAHYTWCITATPGQRQNEINKRKSKLQECDKTERVSFEEPTVCGRRVDTYLNARKGNRLESGVPQKAADAFCRRQGFEKAVNIWFKYNTTYKPEILDETIHMGDDDNNTNCDFQSINSLSVCDSDWPSFRDDCEAFNHIICERPSVP